jgi:hypothetical protein
VRQNPFGVVGHDDDVAGLEPRRKGAQEIPRAGVGDRRRVLVVDAEQLLLLADHPHLARSRPAVAERNEIDAEAGAARGHAQTSGIIAHEPDQRRHAAKADHVGCRIARPAQGGSLARVAENWHGGLRRDARRLAYEILVGNHVADNEDARAGDLVEDVCEGQRRDYSIGNRAPEGGPHMRN